LLARLECAWKVRVVRDGLVLLGKCLFNLAFGLVNIAPFDQALRPGVETLLTRIEKSERAIEPSG
jgi:hypothetical protein